jgi:hypothetical protein
MVGAGAAGTGSVFRAETVRRYADDAGFSTCEVLPIENDSGASTCCASSASLFLGYRDTTPASRWPGAQAGGQLRDAARDGASRRAATCVVRFAYVLRACLTSIGY